MPTQSELPVGRRGQRDSTHPQMKLVTLAGPLILLYDLQWCMVGVWAPARVVGLGHFILGWAGRVGPRARPRLTSAGNRDLGDYGWI